MMTVNAVVRSQLKTCCCFCITTILWPNVGGITTIYMAILPKFGKTDPDALGTGFLRLTDFETGTIKGRAVKQAESCYHPHYFTIVHG